MYPFYQNSQDVLSVGDFQCRGVLLVWMIVGQGPVALAASADGGLFGHFSLIYFFSFLSPSLWETARD